MNTEDVLIKLGTMEDLIYNIQDNLGSSNSQALTDFAALEEIFNEVQSYFDDLDEETP